MIKKIDCINDEEFIKIVRNSRFFKEIAMACGYSKSSAGGEAEVKRRMSRLGLTENDMKLKHHWRPKRPIEEILVKNSSWLGTSQKLKIKLIKEKGWEDKCAECGITNVYNNKPITLQLDHINGDNSDNRINNLRILCPNCHSQTNTFGHKKRISLE